MVTISNIDDLSCIEGENIIRLNEFSYLLRNKLLLFSNEDPDDIDYQEFGEIALEFSIIDDEINVDQIELPRNDPSTIYTKLQIERCNLSDVEKLPYYPSYTKINPKQRWIYINWLKDVNQPIDIGYVFMYYYGLERQLLIGNFNEAFEEILKLRNFHNNNSFQNYSESALLNGCLIKNKLEKFSELDTTNEIKGFSPLQLLLAYNLGYELTADNIYKIMLRIGCLSKKNLRSEPDLFIDTLRNLLQNKFGNEAFAFGKKYDLKKSKKHRINAFANYSFPLNIKSPEVNDFYENEEFIKDIVELHQLTNDSINEYKKRAKRKK